MRKSKQLLYAVICVALLFAKTSFANFPAFDPMSFIPDLKQFKEVAEDLKNTKEQLNQIRQDLRAMGDSIRSVASYSTAVMHKVKEAVDNAEKVVDKINNTLGTDIEVGKGLGDIITETENTQKEIMDNTSNTIENILNGDFPQPSIPTPPVNAGGNNGKTPGHRVPTPNVPTPSENPGDTGGSAPDINIPGGRVPLNPDLPLETPDLDTPPLEKPAPKVPTPNLRVPRSLGEEGILPRKILLPPQGGFNYEEEEEEEEISIEESVAQIKDYFATIRSENKKIATRLNDVLDMHINKLNTSAETGEKSLTDLEQGISHNHGFSIQQKKDISNRIVDIKARLQKIYDWNIILAEKTKNDYNKEFKNKILDGLDNLEKVTIAYLNGDATEKEVKEVSAKVKKDTSTMSSSTDKKVTKDIEKEALKLRKDLTKLSNDIKKIKEKSKSKT